MRMTLESVVIMILVLVLLGFFTLLERKILGLGQIRMGPNKGVLLGLFQPLLDGFKLFMKGSKILVSGGLMNFYILPMVGLIIMLFVWVLLGLIWGSSSVSNLMIMVIMVSSLLIYCFYLSGLFSKSEYGIFGSLRASAQFLSYEGIIFLCLICVYSLMGGFSEVGEFYIWFFVIVMALLLFGVVMEVNRTPVDFVEGESELVSGLVTEMGGLSFSCLILGEYGMMSFYSVLVGELTLGFMEKFTLSLCLMLSFMWALNWLRLSLPRSRCDLMMMVGWKLCLVVVFFMLICSMCVISANL
uniref:NADH-ubiquinone oxidoreductase chain 1 n=1 Tax=Brentisentis yangtzensis TaxID=2604967 RepID=A0A5B9RIF2_9BILA|nr:NADH dehydrogenase subunit 1 [Brentisentis yangtzensis]